MHLFSLHKLRLQLTDYGSLLPYAILGGLAGILGALIALSFELTIHFLSFFWLNPLGIDNYEGLNWPFRFALVLGSAIIIGFALQKMPADSTRVGVVHVIARLHTHHGHLPVRNAVVQYLAGAFALACGQSGGREGPEVHLGSAINSYVGQYLLLPNNSLRILIACGTAAAIAAAFNTPIAGVIFAMEVVIAEYTVAGFLPVIVAAALTYSEVFKQKSAHQTVLKHLNLGIRDSALTRLLHSTNVTRVMDYSVGSIEQNLDEEKVQSLATKTLRWYVVNENSKPLYLIKGEELAEQLSKLEQIDYPCSLNDLGISNLSLSYLPMQATLHEALDIITDSNTEAMLITGQTNHDAPAIRGVLNRSDIEKHYRTHI